MKLIIINGPNLNLLGKREPEVYGDKGFDSYMDSLHQEFPDHTIDHYQSNIEGELIDMLQKADASYDGIILNAGGYTHTSVAIADCIRAIDTAVVEVHITNIYAREEYRRTSLLASACKGSISGFGLDSYRLAVESFLR